MSWLDQFCVFLKIKMLDFYFYCIVMMQQDSRVWEFTLSCFLTYWSKKQLSDSKGIAKQTVAAPKVNKDIKTPLQKKYKTLNLNT